MTFSTHNTKASKLAAADVIEIRSKFAARTHTMEALSREYHVTPGTVRNIVKGFTWQSLPMVKSQEDMDAEILLSQQKVMELMRADISAARKPEVELDEFIKQETHK
jgi:hypothetical protein